MPLRQQIRFCTAHDGVRIAYATTGSGPLLLKVGNWLSQLEFNLDSPVWGVLLRALAQTHTAVRCDQRRTGLSDWDVEDISFEARAELRELDACTLRDLGVGRAEIESMAREARRGAPPTLRRLAGPAATTSSESAAPKGRAAGPDPGRRGGEERPQRGAESPRRDVQKQGLGLRRAALHGAWSHCALAGRIAAAVAAAAWQPSPPDAAEEAGFAAAARDAAVASAPVAFVQKEPSGLPRREASAFTHKEVEASPHR